MNKKMTVKEFLLKTGNYPNLTGFYPLCRAVEIAKEKGKIGITTELYPQLAKEFNSTPTRIERAMRHIITNRITLEHHKELGFIKTPSVSEFVYGFAMRG